MLFSTRVFDVIRSGHSNSGNPFYRYHRQHIVGGQRIQAGYLPRRQTCTSQKQKASDSSEGSGIGCLSPRGRSSSTESSDKRRNDKDNSWEYILQSFLSVSKKWVHSFFIKNQSCRLWIRIPILTAIIHQHKNQTSIINEVRFYNWSFYNYSFCEINNPARAMIPPIAPCSVNISCKKIIQNTTVAIGITYEYKLVFTDPNIFTELFQIMNPVADAIHPI